jgi:hypothetical protein
VSEKLLALLISRMQQRNKCNLTGLFKERIRTRGIENKIMSRSVLVGLFALSLTAGILPDQSNASCLETYKGYVDALKDRSLSPEQRIGLHRWALRAYNACETGDVPDVEGLFERLDRQRL